MGNPALKEFQAKLAEQLADALFDELGHHLDAASLLRTVEKITADWHANHNRNMLRDARGVLHDGTDLQSNVYEPFTPLVRLKVSTFFDREETAEEKNEKAERAAAFFWKPEDGPPPKRVGLLQLLEQNIWWIPKDSAPIKLVDMADSHRRNLAGFLRRNAAHYKNVELDSMFWSMAGPLGPSGDMAQDAAESTLNELENEDPLEWLGEKPLMQALVPTVYLWLAVTDDGKVFARAVREDGLLVASFTAKRRRTAVAAVRPPAAEEAYREHLGGIGPAFYHLVTLGPDDALPEATRIALEEKVDE